jgi:hypothetical protein
LLRKRGRPTAPRGRGGRGDDDRRRRLELPFVQGPANKDVARLLGLTGQAVACSRFQTFFGVLEEGNQDVSSHALTSGILGLENLRLTGYALAQHQLAVAQAVHLRGVPGLLSPRTRPVYDFVRGRAEFVDVERWLCGEVEALDRAPEAEELARLVRAEVLAGSAP